MDRRACPVEHKLTHKGSDWGGACDLIKKQIQGRNFKEINIGLTSYRFRLGSIDVHSGPVPRALLCCDLLPETIQLCILSRSAAEI